MTMRLAEIISRNKLATLWFVFLAITFVASITVVNPTMNPNAHGLSMAQWQLQFAFTPERGMSVLESWGPGAKERYLSVIWIDILFALSYGPFFYMLIKKLGGGFFWSIVPLLEMGTNLIETNLEIYWMTHHSPANPLFAIFFTHSVVASIKWLVLVPIYLVHSVILLGRHWPAVTGARRKEGAPAALDVTEVERGLREVIVEQFRLPPHQVTKETSLVNDLGADSMSLTEMMARIEDRFGTELPEFRHVADKSVGELAGYLATQLAKAPAARAGKE